MKKIRKIDSLGLQILRASKAKRQKVLELVHNNQRLIAEYQKLIDLDSEPKSRVNAFNKRIQELQEKLDEYETELEARDNPTENAAEPLQEFDIESIPSSVRSDYVMWLLGWDVTKNNYYVVEIFTRFVKQGINPPKWVLEILAEGFLEHFRDRNRDPNLLAQKLGLKGDKSGGTNPWQERKLRSERSPAMQDMAILISCFNLSQIRAAKAVKEKYEFGQSPSTLKKYLSKYFGSSTAFVLKPKNALVMDDYERTRFVSSFPVAARKFFNK